MWDLNIVVSRNGARHDHDFPANLPGEGLCDISLLLILLPVGGWHDLEVFEDIDERMLPDGLYHGGGCARLRIQIGPFLHNLGLACLSPALGLHGSS